MNTAAPIADVHLLIGLAVAIVFSIGVSLFAPLQRGIGLCLISLVGAAAFHWQGFVGFVIVNGIAYALACRLGVISSPSRRWGWACVALVALVAVFTLGRVFNWENRLVLSTPAPLLLYSLDMWSALRLVTLFWEVGSGTLQAPSIAGFTTWACLPLTQLGPLLRYSQFFGAVSGNLWLWKSPVWWSEVGAGTAKLVVGQGLYFAQRIISARWPQAHFLNNVTITFVTNPLGFYLTIAGYFHLMEALGQPCGFKLPMSFNFPIGRENISAFWMNWNMTATHVFRDYLFYNRWGMRTYNIYFNTVLLFTLVGLWHAANAYWILWGFLHGLVFCCFLLWRKYNARLGHLPLRGTRISRAAARAFTYFWVCACWYLPSKLLQKLATAW
jgi:hypothetical protein